MNAFRWLSLLGLCATLGCASTGINAGRARFYEGRFEEAGRTLDATQAPKRDQVLLLMERGMAHQAAGDYAGSSAAFNEASATIEELDYISISRKASSMVINDRVLAFRGAPYEQALMHAYCALNYFALALWDDAAVEARILVDRLADLNGYPDDPFSRYVAALAFELVRNHDSAALEYAKVDDLAHRLAVDPATGALRPTEPDEATNATPRAAVSAQQPPHVPGEAELVCFVGFGRIPPEDIYTAARGARGRAAYAEIVVDGRVLGRSYLLSHTARLLAATQSRLAAVKAAKTVGRIVVKESIAHSVSENNSVLGGLLRLALYAAEMPDTRRWETLPLTLHVARVPCPAALTSYTIVFRDGAGGAVGERTVTTPLARRDNTFVSFVREL